ncbi:MAG: AAA family ATPase [Catalinimonas sp.]
MITKIEIDGFKTFSTFEMEFAPLTVIAGTNASGKSNLFDALHLLSRLAETELRQAFREQRGEAIEQFTQYAPGQIAEQMTFAVEMLVDKRVRDNWGAEATLKYTRLRYELMLRREQNQKGIDDLKVAYEHLRRIPTGDDLWMRQHVDKAYVESRRPKVVTGKRSKAYIQTDTHENGTVTIKLPQDGKAGGRETPANVVSQTVLSGINSVDFPHVYAAKEEMRSWRFLRLNPEQLRKPSEYLAPTRIAPDGRHLAAALHRIEQEDAYLLRMISRRLNELLPNLTEVRVIDDPATQRYLITLLGIDGRTFSSRVLSEGTLRLLVLCVLLYDPAYHGLTCFEEPENGVHPLRLRTTVQLLKDLSVDFSEPDDPLRQVIVNTHSPVLLGALRSDREETHDDRKVRVWFSKLVTRVQGHGPNRRIKFQTTKALPVQLTGQTMIPHDDFTNEQRLALAEAIRYLQSVDTENISPQPA